MNVPDGGGRSVVHSQDRLKQPFAGGAASIGCDSWLRVNMKEYSCSQICWSLFNDVNSEQESI